MTVPNHILDKFPKLSSGHLLKNLELPVGKNKIIFCLLYTSPSPRDVEESRMPSSA